MVNARRAPASGKSDPISPSYSRTTVATTPHDVPCAIAWYHGKAFSWLPLQLADWYVGFTGTQSPCHTQLPRLAKKTKDVALFLTVSMIGVYGEDTHAPRLCYHNSKTFLGQLSSLAGKPTYISTIASSIPFDNDHDEPICRVAPTPANHLRVDQTP